MSTRALQLHGRVPGIDRTSVAGAAFGCITTMNFGVIAIIGDQNTSGSTPDRVGMPGGRP